MGGGPNGTPLAKPQFVSPPVIGAYPLRCGCSMRPNALFVALLCASALSSGAAFAQERGSDPRTEAEKTESSREARFNSYLGSITLTTAESPFEAGAATALLLEGPSTKGRFKGEWRQLGELNITVQGRLLRDGKIRLTGKEFVAVCQDSTSVVGLNCLVQTPGGASVALLKEGESGDENNPDCVSCVDERKAGCCQGTGECCTYCAPADECNITSGGESIP